MDDPLNTLFTRFRPSAKMAFSGTVCEMLNDYHEVELGHLHLMRSGSMTVQPRGESAFHLSEPGLVFLPRALPHTLTADEGHVADLLCATVEIGQQSRSPLALALPTVVVLPFREVPHLQPALELLFVEFAGAESGRQTALERLLEYILILVIRHQIIAGSAKQGLLAGLADIGLARSLTAMHEDPKRTWSLQWLAEEAGMSRARFADRFHEVLGVTPMAYLSAWRVSVAQDMLLNGRPAKWAAAEAGYTSAAAFTRAFTRSVGKSPTKWLAERNEASDRSPVVWQET